MKKLAFSLLALAASAQMTLASTVLLDVDFQDGTLGGAVVSGTGVGRTVSVVDESTTPADPFGTTGNKSLAIIHESGSTGGAATARWDLSEQVTEAEVTFSFYAVKDSNDYTTPNGIVYLYRGSTIAMRIKFENGVITLGGATTDGGAYGVINISAPLAPNQAYDVKIAITDGRSFSVHIDDVLLSETGTGQSTFYLAPGISYVNRVTLANASSASTKSFVAFDDLKVTAIPEPSSVAMLTLAAGVGGLAFRRVIAKK